MTVYLRLLDWCWDRIDRAVDHVLARMEPWA